MTGFIADVDANVAAAYEEAQSGGNGTFPPLPGGKYVATIVPLKKDGPNAEVVDFGGNGANAKKKVVRLAFRIVDESPTGKGRHLFARIPLFSRYAPSQKHPQGAPARAYFDFWIKAIGWPEAEVLAGRLPGPLEIMGKRVTLTLSDPKPAESAYDLEHNPLGTNEISFYDKAGDPQSAPRRTPGVPIAPWLDADDNLIEQWAPAAQATTQAAPSWGTPPAVGNVTPGPWSQGATDPALQQAATSGRSF